MANNGLSDDTICLVCNSNLKNTSCINIFCTSLPRNNESLASFVLSVIHPSAVELNSNYICTQCYNLFQMLEQARWTATNIESEIFKIYQLSRDRRKLNNTIISTNTNDNELFIKNSILHEKLDVTANIDQFVHIQPFQSLNDQTNIPPKTHPTIIEDINITHLQIIKTPSINLSSNSSNLIAVDHNEKNISSLSTDSLNEIPNHTQIKSKTITAIHIYQCKICTRLFDSMNDLEKHWSKHDELLSYQCEKCQKQFSNLSDVNSHSLEIHGEKEKLTVIINSETLENKTIAHSNDKDCLHLKNNSKTLKDILDNETTETIINNNDTENYNNTNDIRTNTLNEVIKSNRKNNTRSSNIRKKSKCNNKQLNYSCSTCGKTWKTSSELKSHMKTHSSVRPYMCEKCGQAYKHKHALEIHIGMHNGINPFQCDFCNKCFTQKGALMRHLPIHTGEMPYQCEICGKRFVHHTSYNMHTLSHTGKKTHQCPNCDLSLLSTSHLKRHMRVHTGEKPFSCPSCGKRFAERYNLCAHQKIHGTSEVITKSMKKLQYKCGQCLASFDIEENLQHHIQQQHHTRIQMENNVEWINQREESTGVNQNVNNNWDNFSYPRSIQSIHQSFND